MRYKLHKLLLSAVILTNLNGSDDLFDESLESILNENVEIKAQLGTRENSKNILDSASAVDVITSEQIENSGQTKLTNLLKYFVAGFNVIETSVADGSDHVNSFTLRGMSSDQVLVLVNGKRLHTSALLHEGSVILGSGTTHVDLNTIPLIAIEKIEILRDGAAAQYGSDAISGVINIIFKGEDSNKITLHTGKRKKGDGETEQIESFLSIPLKYDGFANIALQATKSKQTQRAGVDRRITPEVQTTHAGLPDEQSMSIVFNTQIPQKNDNVYYATILGHYKNSDSSAFYRTPDDTRAIYPEGFLPIITGENKDLSSTFGINGIFSNSIKWDISNTYGYNSFTYGLKDSMNYTLGIDSPTTFNSGELEFIQNSTNIDLKKETNNYTIAVGAEYRYENYKIKAGDESSYVGTASQGFAGFRPDNEVDVSRGNYAVYSDINYKVDNQLTTQLALRYENYSDFGSTKDVKGSVKYKVTPKLLLRSTASTGFRAPSLAQSNFSHTSSFLSGSDLLLKGIFSNSHPVSQSLGATPLKPEKSNHFALGSVYEISNESYLTVDYFYITVRDRIIISDKLYATTLDQISIFNSYGVNQASYLTNAIDTKTDGVDIKFNNKYEFKNSSILDSTFWYHYNKNKITSINGTISDAKMAQVQNGQPNYMLKMLNQYTKGQFTYGLNISRFGSMSHALGATVYKFDPVTTVDLNINYKYNKKVSLSLGGNNIFDVMPDKWDRSNPYLGYDGMLPYSNNSPIGYSGAYYYVKLSCEF